MSRQQCDEKSKLEPSTGIKKNPANSYHFDHVISILTCQSLINNQKKNGYHRLSF